MIYELKHFDKTVLKFSAVDDSNEPDIKITWIDDDKTLLPLDLDVSDEGLYKWLKHRTIPSNRAYVRNFLSKCGLSLNRPMNIIKVSKGLPLNDCYWIVEEGFDENYGARPIRRAVRSLIEDELSEKLLSGELQGKSKITCDFDGERMVFDAK